jgi:hypothetical protein
VNLARLFLLKASKLPHLQTKAQRHAWVRAKLAYPAPRVHIGVKAAEPQRRFARSSGLRYGTAIEIGPRVRAWVADKR